MKNIFPQIFLFFQESAETIVRAPNQTLVEPTIINLVSWLKLAIETTGAIIIAVGVVLAIVEFVKVLLTARPEGYTSIRLLLARYLALALEFQLGADILSTAISPSWDQIGKLGAIAVIRTALNFFLSREMEQEKKITEAEYRMDDRRENDSTETTR
ncbi:MAG TPA: DUF1622 domain-containing protein [Pyrinomonadaceae bacterium]|nr:DUF1622 domain-containing protein [Pyrinomonadaceae bacterium]